MGTLCYEKQMMISQGQNYRTSHNKSLSQQDIINALLDNHMSDQSVYIHRIQQYKDSKEDDFFSQNYQKILTGFDEQGEIDKIENNGNNACITVKRAKICNPQNYKFFRFWMQTYENSQYVLRKSPTLNKNKEQKSIKQQRILKKHIWQLNLFTKQLNNYLNQMKEIKESIDIDCNKNCIYFQLNKIILKSSKLTNNIQSISVKIIEHEKNKQQEGTIRANQKEINSIKLQGTIQQEIAPNSTVYRYWEPTNKNIRIDFKSNNQIMPQILSKVTGITTIIHMKDSKGNKPNVYSCTLPLIAETFKHRLPIQQLLNINNYSSNKNGSGLKNRVGIIFFRIQHVSSDIISDTKQVLQDCKIRLEVISKQCKQKKIEQQSFQDSYMRTKSIPILAAMDSFMTQQNNQQIKNSYDESASEK